MFTKAQIAKLPVEQQEVLAQIELSKARQREQLLKEARGLDWRSRYFPIYIFAVFMIFIALYYFNALHLQESLGVLYLMGGMMFVSGLIFHITRLNRRLDALLKLLEMDHKLQNTADISKDEKIG